MKPINSFRKGDTDPNFLYSALSLYFLDISLTSGISKGALYRSTEDLSSVSIFGLKMRGILGLMMFGFGPLSGEKDGI